MVGFRIGGSASDEAHQGHDTPIMTAKRDAVDPMAWLTALRALGNGLSAQVGGVHSQGVEFEARTHLAENLQAIIQGIPYNMASA
jgi:hypothetical protein